VPVDLCRGQRFILEWGAGLSRTHPVRNFPVSFRQLFAAVISFDLISPQTPCTHFCYFKTWTIKPPIRHHRRLGIFLLGPG
jgi:hypothetical protein